MANGRQLIEKLVTELVSGSAVTSMASMVHHGERLMVDGGELVNNGGANNDHLNGRR